MSMNFKLNYKPAPQDSRDYVIKPKLFTLPSSVDLTVDTSTEVKNQGTVGSCTAFAGCALNELVCAKAGVNIDFSEKFLYFATRVDTSKWPANEDSGSSIRDTLKAMNSVGICTEATFPYLRNGETECSFADVPPPSAYTEAKTYLSTNYAAISDSLQSEKVLQSMKTLLNGGYSFVGGFNCYQNIFDDIKGVIPEPVGNVIGGHAVLFVGYDDEKSLLKFKNSWGSNWGDNGYGYLPYNYVLSRNVFDIWTVYNVSHVDRPFDVLVPQNRYEEYENRMRDIMTKIGEGMDVPSIHQYINNDPRNALLYPADIGQLVSFGTQTAMSYSHSKNMVSRNKLDY